MKMDVTLRLLLVTLLIAPAVSPSKAGLPKLDPKTTKALTAVAAGVAEVLVAASAGGKAADQVLQIRDLDQALIDLKEQGVDESNDTLYSVYFSLNNDASSVYWADIFNKPDVFIIIDIEGRGSFLVPNIWQEYNGAPIIETLLSKETVRGGKVGVYVLDDDSLSNDIWNSLLQTQVSWKVDGKVPVVSPVEIQVSASGKIALLNSNHTIDSKDLIASAIFEVPANKVDWSASANLLDEHKRSVGRIELRHMPSLQWKRYTDIKADRRTSAFQATFFGIVSLAALAVFAKRLLKKSQTPVLG